MIDDHLTPDEAKLIQQIQAAVKPTLDPAARDAIRQQMLREFRTIPFQRPVTRFPVRVIFAAAAMIVIIGFIVVFLANPPRGIIIDTPTSQAVAEVASETPIASAETPTVILTPTLVTVTEISIVSTATPIPPSETHTPSIPTPTLETLLMIEGPVTNITGNSVTVYGFEIEVEPQHPILKIIEVGDVVRVQGRLGSDGTMVAVSLGNITSETVVSSGTPTVGLDGPVESIDDNIIVVNDIPVRLKPDDPLLKTLQVGNFVTIQGNFEISGSTIVLVVVSIAVKNVPAVQSDCWYHDDAMGMGHWHCDGMGMGNPGMGMGDAMGMGDEGMGMGGAMGMGG